jgi:pilus assembly protein FimV
LDLSEFDMPSETAGGATTEELDDLEVDESFFLDDDSDAGDGQPQPSSEDAPILAAPAADLELPATDDGDAISVEDLVFDEFDAGDDEVDGFESIVDSESVATKLDLARAYIDMGDSEGAREMLEEVLQEGDAQQQADAKSLLDNIG